MAITQKLSTNLWFDNEAQEASEFYTSVFTNSRMGRIAYYPAVGQEIHHRPAGSVMTVEFELEGQSFVALNGGPDFKFNEAISTVINCDTQEEVDYYWEKLSDGGDPAAQQCGWLKDKFGLSWQVMPTLLADIATADDKEAAARTFAAMLQMKKLDIAALEKASRGE